MSTINIHWPSVLAFLTIVGMIAGFASWLRPQMKSLMLLLDDWNGTSERPGVARKPGVMERLCVIEDKLSDTNYHVQPNHGNSSFDRQIKLLEEINDKLNNFNRE